MAKTDVEWAHDRFPEGPLPKSRPRHVLPVIVFSQFAGTSLWFAGNAVLADLSRAWDLAPRALGWITSAVQLGFICGTLVFAIFALSDRFSPAKLFLGCALLGAGANGMLLAADHLAPLLGIRFFTGFFLAGIYPVGMKIAAAWYREDLGKAIGYLVGALVLGTAFPHWVRSVGAEMPWQHVLLWVSLLAALGGLTLFLTVPDGPHLPRGQGFQPRVLWQMFRLPAFRASAFGYFGHMWELYTFWAFVPWILAVHPASALEESGLSAWAFGIIALGALGCVGGGIASRRWGSAPVAFVFLAISGGCCVLWPVALFWPKPWFLAFLILWGIAVIGDSAQFSALTARNAPRLWVGSALTVVTCIGFSLTIVSIELTGFLAERVAPRWLFLFLLPGPVFGLISMVSLLGRESE